jgi:hypothetical protein
MQSLTPDESGSTDAAPVDDAGAAMEALIAETAVIAGEADATPIDDALWGAAMDMLNIEGLDDSAVETPPTNAPAGSTPAAPPTETPASTATDTPAAPATDAPAGSTPAAPPTEAPAAQ